MVSTGDFERDSAVSGTRIDVADVLRRPGAETRARVQTTLADLDLTLARVAGDVTADLRLEGVLDGVVASAVIAAPIELQCRRCARMRADTLDVDAAELFTDDPDLLADADVYPVDGTLIDIEQYLRDAIGLELPDAPLLCDGDPAECPFRPDVAVGPGDATTESAAIDPRWEPLRRLAEQEMPPDTDPMNPE